MTAASAPNPAAASPPETPSTARRKLPLRRRLLYAAVMCLLVLGVLALVGEGVCRWLAPQGGYETIEPAGNLHQVSADMYLGFELRPNVRDHNTAGYRGHECLPTKPSGTWRIAIVGDSVPYGLGVTADDAFPAVLEKRLHAAGAGPVEVLNFGVPAYNTFQYCTLLETRVAQFAPDLVVMVFSPDDVETSPVVLKVDGKYCLFRNEFEGSALVNNRVHWSLFRWSHLYRLLYKSAVLTFAAPGERSGDVARRPEVAWRNVCRAAAFCREHKMRFLLVLSPHLLPLYRPRPEAHAERQDAPEMIIDLEQVRLCQQALDRVRELAKSSDIDFLDLGPLYRRHEGQLKLRPIDHEHLNPRGHRLVAEALAERLLAGRGKNK